MEQKRRGLKFHPYRSHNPQSFGTEDLFIIHECIPSFTIKREPYKKELTKEQTRNYIYDEFMKLILLDVLENNDVFMYNTKRLEFTIQKDEIKGDKFLEYYKKGVFRLDYLKSNFTGHFTRMRITRKSTGSLIFKNIFLSGYFRDLRDKMSELW